MSLLYLYYYLYRGYLSDPFIFQRGIFLSKSLYSSIDCLLLALCPEPGLRVDFSLAEKDENYLHYWKFPVSCGAEAEQKIDVEVMQDQLYCYVHDGDIELVYKSDRPIGNSWEGVDGNPSSEMQSGAEIISFSTIAMTLIPLVFFYFLI